MDTKQQHTPTPWKQCPENPRQIERDISNQHDVPVATVRYVLGVTDEGEANANAALIVRAVNGHERLVKAAADFLYAFGGDVPDWLRNEADELHRAVDAAREEK